MATIRDEYMHVCKYDPKVFQYPMTAIRIKRKKYSAFRRFISYLFF